MWRQLEMHTSHDIGGGCGEKLFPHPHSDSVRGKLVLVKRFDEIPSCIPVDKWFDNRNTGQWLRDDFHEEKEYKKMRGKWRQPFIEAKKWRRV